MTSAQYTQISGAVFLWMYFLQMLEWQFAETLDLWCIQKISFQFSPLVPILNMEAKTFKTFTC